MHASDIIIPDNWPETIRRAVLHAASLAHASIIHTRSWCANSSIARTRLAGLLDQAKQEISLLNEEIRILRTRIEKIAPKHRPHYFPAERLSILLYKASRGWNQKKTAHAFGLTEETISSWLHELETCGPETLVRIPVPHNKYPDCLRYLAGKLKVLCPRFGKKAIAEYFFRAGIRISFSSIGRYLRHKWDKLPPGMTERKSAESDTPVRRITSRHPGHIWIADLTVVPASQGFWTSIMPYTIKQCWPFCWWLMVIIDHYSRKAVGFALFKTMPSSQDVTRTLNKAILIRGKPRHIITDKGTQFNCMNYRDWCKRKKIKFRYGAVGKYGSIAIVERFIKTITTVRLK